MVDSPPNKIIFDGQMLPKKAIKGTKGNEEKMLEHETKNKKVNLFDEQTR